MNPTGPQGVEKAFSPPYKCQPAKAGWHLKHHFLENGHQRCRILRPENDKGYGILPFLGDVHAAACGYKMKGLPPFIASRKFVHCFFDCLKPQWVMNPTGPCIIWNAFRKSHCGHEPEKPGGDFVLRIKTQRESRVFPGHDDGQYRFRSVRCEHMQRIAL